MKKLLLLSVCVCLSMPVMAQRVSECAYSALQSLIINARSAEELRALIQRGIVLDEQVRCGGSLMQLAIRRGNPDVLRALLEQDQKRANALVSMEGFAIPGAPKILPLILFAAYYAPNEDMIRLLVSAGANVSVTDDVGRNLLWYMDKNPVLRNTALTDEMNNQLLYGMAVSQGDLQGGATAPAAQYPQGQGQPQQRTQAPSQNQMGQARNMPSANSGLIDER